MALIRDTDRKYQEKVDDTMKAQQPGGRQLALPPILAKVESVDQPLVPAAVAAEPARKRPLSLGYKMHLGLPPPPPPPFRRRAEQASGSASSGSASCAVPAKALFPPTPPLLFPLPAPPIPMDVDVNVDVGCLAAPAPPLQLMPAPEPPAVPAPFARVLAVPGSAAAPQPGHPGFLAMPPPRTSLQDAGPGVPLAKKAGLLQPPYPHALPQPPTMMQRAAAPPPL